MSVRNRRAASRGAVGLPQARLLRQPTADGLTKAVGGCGQHDTSLGPSKRHRRLPKALEVDGHAGQVQQLAGDLEALQQLAMGLLVAGLPQGGERQGPEHLALVPGHPQRAGPGKARPGSC
jgi:hypothetical protein